MNQRFVDRPTHQSVGNDLGVFRPLAGCCVHSPRFVNRVLSEWYDARSIIDNARLCFIQLRSAMERHSHSIPQPDRQVWRDGGAGARAIQIMRQL
ncbi:hypothetical protein [Phreatobacter oligotrophus]|jgi:hypothetical protein|uniref:hypothetical protein n=1 Tax=Phreatobacter oligotrophus TaxID=1122261 RepID=UPI0023573E9B|nr:hypothetical protein [Phreatobacter oligotrophus]MBX9990666.1 hypothetical protein [Phreatobacter oligotrophus]